MIVLDVSELQEMTPCVFNVSREGSGEIDGVFLVFQGYRKRLQLILEEAGLRLTANQRQQLAAAVVAHEEKEKQKQATDFNSLAHCTQVRCRKKVAFVHHKMALAHVVLC